MSIQVTLDFNINRCPPEILEMETYKTFLIQEIEGYLLNNKSSYKFFHDSRKIMENWWSGNLTKETYTYGLHSAIKDVYDYILRNKMIGPLAHLYNTKETIGLQDTEVAIVEMRSSEDQIDFSKFLINFWTLLSKHREYKFHLLFKTLAGYYVVALMANETYLEQISNSYFKNQWTEIEFTEQVPKGDMLVYELDRSNPITIPSFVPYFTGTDISIGGTDRPIGGTDRPIGG